MNKRNIFGAIVLGLVAVTGGIGFIRGITDRAINTIKTSTETVASGINLSTETNSGDLLTGGYILEDLEVIESLLIDTPKI